MREREGEHTTCLHSISTSSTLQHKVFSYFLHQFSIHQLMECLLMVFSIAALQQLARCTHLSSIIEREGAKQRTCHTKCSLYTFSSSLTEVTQLSRMRSLSRIHYFNHKSMYIGYRRNILYINSLLTVFLRRHADKTWSTWKDFEEQLLMKRQYYKKFRGGLKLPIVKI